LAGIGGLSLPAPIPPLALVGWQPRIASLCDGRAKCVQAANIDVPAGDFAELLIQANGILFGEVRDIANAQEFKIAEYSGPDGDQIFEVAGGRHKNSLTQGIMFFRLF
jgi:hypothetical protein